MKEIIIIKTENSQNLRHLLDNEHIDYEIYQEPNQEKANIFANYDKAIKDKIRKKELTLWDNVDSNEDLNNDGEWWK